MTVVFGKSIFTCPVDGRQVILNQDCIGCEKFKFWGVKGARPYVACDVELPEQKEVPKEKTKTEGLSGLERW